MSVLDVRNLAHRYGKNPVLNSVSFSLEPGQIVGILGRNGAGKSTLFRLLSGILPLQEGEIAFQGHVAATRSQVMASFARAQMGVVFQSNSLEEKLSGLANLQLSARLYGVKQQRAEAAWSQDLEHLGVYELRHQAIKKLSGGTKRKFELARALLHRPQLLILDEPSAGFDFHAFHLFWERLRQLQAQDGLCVLMATHSVHEAQYCDKILILHEGRILAFDTPANLLSQVEGDRVVIKFHEEKRPDLSEQALLALQHKWPTAHFSCTGDLELTVRCQQGAHILPRLVEHFESLSIEWVFVRGPTLEDAFLRITGEALRSEEAQHVA